MPRQVDVKTAIALFSAGVAIAGGSGTVIGSRAAASTEAKVERLEEAKEQQRAVNADLEARMRTLERTTTEIGSDVKHIKGSVDRLVDKLAEKR